MAKKITAYQAGFDTFANTGTIVFQEEGKPDVVHLNGLSVQEFTALSLILTSGNAYAQGHVIFTEGFGSNAQPHFASPPEK